MSSGYVSRADTGPSDPEEWREGARIAREARRRVATAAADSTVSVVETLGDMVVEADLTGSKGYAVGRLRQLAEAEQARDPFALRAAAIEASAALAAYAVAIDVSLPVRGPRSVSSAARRGAAGSSPGS